MQNPITFLAPQPAANTSKQVKSSTSSGETAPNSFKQVLSKEISENRNATKDKPANQVENKSIPQDAKKNTSSQPTKIEPIAEDEAKDDVAPTENNQTNGVQLIALVESLAQFSQKISEKSVVPTNSEIPAIEVTSSKLITNEIPVNIGSSTSKLNQKNDPSQIIQAQLKAGTPPISGDMIEPLVEKANTKFSLGEQPVTQALPINDTKLVNTAPTSGSTEAKLAIDLALDQIVEKRTDFIGAANVEPKIAIKNDSAVAPVTDPKIALKEDVKSVVIVDPKTSLKEDLKATLLTVSNTNPKMDSMLASTTDLKTDLKPGLQLASSTDLTTDLQVSLQTGKKEELKIDFKQDLRTDLKADLKTDLKIESKSNLTTDLKFQEAVNNKEPSSKVTEITPVSQNFAQQIAISSGQINATSEVEHLTPRVGSPAWNQSVGQKIVWMVAGGQQTAELTLNPPDLGPMQVVLSVNNDQANATFISAHPDVREALESAMPRLRQMMNDAGIQLSGFSVKSESSNAGGNFAGDRSSPRAKNNSPDTVVGTSAITATTTTIRQSPGSGIVDTFA